AAGNNAQAGDPPQYPAAYPGVLSVGAIAPDGTRAEFSQRTGVSVVAPGKGLVGLRAGDRSNGLVGNDGTSFAAPFVAGVAALVMAYHPRLSADQVLRRIQATADHPAGPLPDRQFGWGVVNPLAAVTTILPEEGSLPVARPTPSALALAPRAESTLDGRTAVVYGLALGAIAVVALGLIYLTLRARSE